MTSQTEVDSNGPKVICQ